MAGGGGGNTTTTTAAIDPDIKARVLPALDDVTNLYRDGNLARLNINDLNRSRTIADDQVSFAQQVAQEGLGEDVIAQDLQNFAGQQGAASQGALGSARQQRANAAGLGDRALQLRQADLATKKDAYAGGLQAAEAGRALEQERLDQPHTASQRYFGYLSSAPQSQSSTQSGGGGK